VVCVDSGVLHPDLNSSEAVKLAIEQRRKKLTLTQG